MDEPAPHKRSALAMVTLLTLGAGALVGLVAYFEGLWVATLLAILLLSAVGALAMVLRLRGPTFDDEGPLSGPPSRLPP